MKRCNQNWGAQRISDELQLMGIKVSKKTVLKVLRVNGFVPPQTRFTPPSWRSVLDSLHRYWAMDFTTVFDSKGIQLFILILLKSLLASLSWLIQRPTQHENGWYNNLETVASLVTHFRVQWFTTGMAFLVIGCQASWRSLAANHLKRRHVHHGKIHSWNVSTYRLRLKCSIGWCCLITTMLEISALPFRGFTIKSDLTKESAAWFHFFLILETKINLISKIWVL